MSRRAWVYIAAVLFLASAASAAAFLSSPLVLLGLTFPALLAFAVMAQLIKARAPNHQSYHITLVFFMAGIILLHPFLYVILVVASHVVEWVKERLVNSPRLRKWYLQPFNIATHILAGILASVAYSAINAMRGASFPDISVGAMVASALVYVGANHLLVGFALVLARKVSLKESEILEWQNLANDFVLLLLGGMVAVVWQINPWLILPALAPLVMMYQALQVPLLKKQASTDDKTGLWNARHFAQLFMAEMKRAVRFNRPLAFIMADLDLLRNINNTYGHLAGDAVLAGIGQILRDSIREYDIAGRFGGEEFAIALPETGPMEALAIAERIRSAVEERLFKVATYPVPIRATLSIGIASYPGDATDPNTLIHQADIAVYQAKLSGRNRIVSAHQVPSRVKMNFPTALDRLTVPYVPYYEPRPDVSSA